MLQKRFTLVTALLRSDFPRIVWDCEILVKTSPCLFVIGFRPLDLRSSDWCLLSCLTRGFATGCPLVVLKLWDVHQLLFLCTLLLVRLHLFPLSICNIGFSNTVVLNLALTPACLTYWRSATLHLKCISPSPWFPLVDAHSSISCHFEPPSATSP